MDMLMSILVWIALLIFAYFLCTSLGEYSSAEGRFLPEGSFFKGLEKLALIASVVGMTVMAGGIVWMFVLAHLTGALSQITGG